MWTSADQPGARLHDRRRRRLARARPAPVRRRGPVLPDLYRSSLVAEWLPAVDGLVERLESGIRVVDVGCGLGSATILMAQAFPASTFVGVDYHEESVRRATAAAEAAGVADRVRFEVRSMRRRTPAPTTWSATSTPCTTWATRRRTRPCAERAGGGGPGVRRRAVRSRSARGHRRTRWTLADYVSRRALCVPNSVSQGGAALGAQAGPARLTAAFVDAGFSTAHVAATTAYNLVIEAHG